MKQDRLDFKSMCEKEPRLRELERDIFTFRVTKGRLGSSVFHDWYNRFKPRLMELVGWEASNVELVNSDCYEIAYNHLCELLTDRKHRPIMAGH